MVFRLSQRRVDLRAATVEADDGGQWSLSPTEVRLLQYLARTPGEIVGREELLREVWGYAARVRTRTIDTTCSRLRAKLESTDGPAHLVTVYGLGVRLDGLTRERVVAASVGPLVGRAAELGELRRSIGPGCLVTVLGPGGAGKTRLAAEVAATLDRPVVQVDAAGVRGPHDLDRRVREALGLGEGLEVGAALRREGPVVVVVDECEGSIDAVVDRVVAWLGAAPQLCVVATSRVPLGLAAEQRVPLGPLDEGAAVELFVARAQARDPNVVIAEEEVRGWVALIDRLPLAVELAAGRLSVVGSDALGSLLQTPLQVLGSSHGPSMAEQLERSFQLLSERDRALLVRLAVFEAPFDLDAAAAVAGTGVAEAIRGIEALVDRSLLQRQPDGRFRPYVVVRERARLEPRPPDLASSHGRWFARLGTREVLDRAPSERAVCRSLQAARADLWAAVAATEEVDPTIAASCLAALAWLVGRDGADRGLSERLARFPRHLAARRERFELLRGWSRLLRDTGDHESARAVGAEALAVAEGPYERWRATELFCSVSNRAGGDVRDRGYELLMGAEADATASGERSRWLLSLGMAQARPEAAAETFLEAARLARREGDWVGELVALLLVARRKYALEGDWEHGRMQLERVLAWPRRYGWPRAEANVCAHLGTLGWFHGDLESAEAWLEQGAELYARTVDRTGRSIARCLVARVWTLQGRFDEAVELALGESAEPRFPSYEAAFASLAMGEAHLHAGRVRAARAALDATVRHATAGGYVEVEADALELRAALELDPEWLDRAVARDPRGRFGDVRRAALRAYIAAARGEPGAAAAAAEAERLCDALGLLPGSEPHLWVARARRAPA